jgi:glycosyltransferase involved in cell wall biosynthesis
MRVLVATKSFDRSEQAIYLGLSRLGHEINVACFPNAPRQSALIEAGIGVHQLQIRHRMDLRASRSLRDLIDRLDTDLVYASSNVSLAAALRATRGTRTPVVAYRGTMGHISRLDPASRLTFLHPRLARTACVSNAVRDDLLARGISERKLVTVYKGHDPHWYAETSPIELRDVGIPKESAVITFAGAIRPVKGIPILLEAMQLLPESIDAHLLLLGEVRDGRTRRRIKIAGPKCHSPGHHEHAIGLVAASSLFVMPSLEREGLPRAVIEAMCLGVPPIVTDVGGMPELVEDRKNGRVVPAGNPRALADAMIAILSDRDLRDTYGQNARLRIEEHFNIKTTITRMATLFEETLSQS